MALSISKTDIRSVMKFIAVFLIIILAINIPILIKNYNDSQIYEAALQELEQGNYAAAEQKFAQTPNYHDAQALSVYCQYTQIYENETEYVGGFDEIAAINLKYEKSLQADVDLLQRQINRRKLQKEADDKAAELAAKEAELKEKYSGKLPVDDMPVSCLKYTLIGEPTKVEKCQSYDNMDVHQRYKILRWYNNTGQIIADCYSHLPKGEAEEVIYAFSYHDPFSVRTNPAPTTYPNNSANDYNSGSLRDDYDDPEDLWEEDKGFWYEDEDEAWDEWYDD